MTTSLVVTFVGPDRPGLVELLSRTIAEHGGNWLDSRLCSLSGQFAGIVLARVPDADAAPLRRALGELQVAGLKVLVETAAGEAPHVGDRMLRLELIGQDRPGIVREVSRVFREHAANIEELHTETVSGAMSGETLFKAIADIRVARGTTVAQLRSALEALANDIMVDIALKEVRDSAESGAKPPP
jgi:glycine cleavage system regulatory protein